MLEGVASAVLMKLLGDYVTGLEANNLKFTLSGELELHNLRIKPSALQGLGLPIKISQGFLSKLYLSVPWRSLGSKPAVIRLEGLFVLAHPASADSIDEEDMERREQAAKQRRLEVAEVIRASRAKSAVKDSAQAQPKDPDTPKPNKPEEETFTKRMITSVINSLQVSVEKVHRCFAVGVVLDSVGTRTTDANFSAADLTKPDGALHLSQFIFKLLELKHAGVYWNTKDKPLVYGSVEELGRRLEALIPSDSNRPRHDYLLEPTSLTNKLVVNKSDIPRVGVPKVRSELSVGKVSVVLRERQYLDLVALSQRTQAFQRARKYRHIQKPTKSVREAPGAWFRWAGACARHEAHLRLARWHWATMKQRRDDRIEYIALYKQQRVKGKLTQSETEALARLERKLSYDDILFFRSLAGAHLRREQKAGLGPQGPTPGPSGYTAAAAQTVATGAASLYSWTSSFFRRTPAGPGPGAGSPTSALDSAPPVPKFEEPVLFGVKLSEEDWKEIVAALVPETATDEAKGPQADADAPRAAPADWTVAIARIALDLGYIELRDEDEVPLTTITFRGLVGELALRDLSASAVSMTDAHTRHSFFPLLVEPQSDSERRRLLSTELYSADKSSTSAEAERPLFAVRVESNPPPAPGADPLDFSLDFRLERLNLVYNPSFIARIVDFFYKPFKAEAVEEERVTYQWSVEQRRSQLLFLIQRRKRFAVTINAQAPNVIVPKDPTDGKAPMLVFVLGHALVETKLAHKSHDLPPPATSSSSALDANVRRDFYDTYSLQLRAVQAVMSHVAKFDGLFLLPPAHLAKKQLLQPFDVILDLAVCKVNVESLVNLRVEGALPSLGFFLPRRKVRALLAILYGVMDQMSSPTPPASSARTSAAPTVPKGRAGLSAATDALVVGEGLGEFLPDDSADEPDEAPKGTLADVVFTMPELTIQLREDFDLPDSAGPTAKRHQDLVLFTMRRFAMNFVKKDKLTQIDVEVATVTISDLAQPWGADFQMLATSFIDDAQNVSLFAPSVAGGDKLVRLSMLSIDPKHPDYKNIDRQTTLTVNHLAMNFNRETVAQLMSWFANFLPSPQEIKNSTPDTGQGASSAIAATPGPDLRPSVPPTPGPLRPALPDESPVAEGEGTRSPTRYSNQVSLIINAIRLTLNDEGSALAVATLSDSFASVALTATATEIKGHLGALKIQDLRTDKFTHVVAIRGEHMVDFAYDTRPHRPFAPTFTSLTHLYIQLNAMRLILNMRFVEDMWRFVSVFLAMLGDSDQAKRLRLRLPDLPADFGATSTPVVAPDTPGDAPAPPSASPAPAAVTGQSLFQYHVRLLNPLITMPVSDDVPDNVTMDLGEIDVRNEFYFSPQGAMLEELALSVKRLNAQSGHYSEALIHPASRIEHARFILKNTDLFLHSSRPYAPAPSAALHTGPAASVDIAIPTIKFVLAPEQLQLILLVFKENWYYFPSKRDADQRRALSEASERTEAKKLAAAKASGEFSPPLLTTTMQLTLELGSISIDCRNHVVLNSAEKAEKICEIVTNAMEVSMVTLSDQSLTVDFDLQAIECLDRRSDADDPQPSHSTSAARTSSPYGKKTNRRFVGRTGRSELPQVRGKFLRQPSGQSEVQILLDRLQILMLPKLFLLLAENLRPVLSPWAELSERRARVAEVAMTPAQRLRAREIAANPHIGFDVKLTMAGTQLLLLEDQALAHTEEKSRAIEMGADLSLTFASGGPDTHVTLGLQDFHIVKGLFSDLTDTGGEGGGGGEEPVVSLLAPVNLSVEYAASHPITGPSSVDWRISTANYMKFVVSYRDFKLASAIAAQWGRDSAVVTAPGPNAPPKSNSSASGSPTAPRAKPEGAATSPGTPKGVGKSGGKRSSFHPLLDPSSLSPVATPLSPSSSMIGSTTQSIGNFAALQSPDAPPAEASPVVASAGLDPDEFTDLADTETYQDDDKDSETSSNPTDSAANPSPGASLDLPRPAPQAQAQTQKFFIPACKWTVVVIDDVERGVEIPIFSLKLATGAIRLTNWSSQMDGALVGRGSIDYYNLKNACWEPFLEPWDFTVHIQAEKYKLMSHTLLNVNLTKALLNSGRALAQSWREDFYAQPSPASLLPSQTSTHVPRHLLEHQYYLKNDTGLGLVYFLHGAGDEAARPTTLPVHAEHPLHLSRSLDPRTNTAKTAGKRLSLATPRQRDRNFAAQASGAEGPGRPFLHVQIQGFPEIRISNLDQAGKHCVHLSPTRRIVYEISNRYGAKVVTFSSTTLVSNHTSVPIQIAFEKPSAAPTASAKGPAPQGLTTPTPTTASASKKGPPTAQSQPPLASTQLLVLPTLEPGKSTAVPLWMVFEGALRFRPAPTEPKGAAKFRWSSTKCECLHLKPETRLVVAPSKTDKAPPFLFAVRVEHPLDDSGIRTHDQMEIKVSAPIVLENLLAGRMKFRLVDKVSGQTIVEDLVLKGDRYSIYSVSPRQELQLAIRLGGYKWSEREFIVGPRVPATRVVLFHEANPDDSLQLNIDNTLTPDGVRIVSIYCPFWLVNKTGLPLQCTTKSAHSRGDTEEALTLEQASTEPWLLGREARDQFYEDLLNEPAEMFYPHRYQSGKFFFKLGHSLWSKGFNLNTQNATTVLTVLAPREAKGGGAQRAWEVALSIYPARHKFWKTRIITLSPRYLLVNKTDHTIIFRQKGTEELHSILAGEKLPLHWSDDTKERKLRVRLNVPHCSWSGPIDPTELERYPLRLFNTKTGRVFIVRVKVTAFAAQSMSIITLEDESFEHPLFRVDNLTDEQILLRQKETQLSEIIRPHTRHAWSWHEPTKTYEVEAQFGSRGEVWAFSLAKIKQYQPLKVKSSSSGHTVGIRIQVKTDRFTRVLQFRNLRARRGHGPAAVWALRSVPSGSLPTRPSTENLSTARSVPSALSRTPSGRSSPTGPGPVATAKRSPSSLLQATPASDNSAAQAYSVSPPSSPAKFAQTQTSGPSQPPSLAQAQAQAPAHVPLSFGSKDPSPTPAIATAPTSGRSEEKNGPGAGAGGAAEGFAVAKLLFKLQLHFEKIGFSIINERPEELLYVSLEDVNLEVEDYGLKRSVEFEVSDLQIDNQLPTTYHPVMLFSAVKEPPQFFKFALIQSREHKDIDYYNYVSLLCREFHLQLDEELLIKLLSFIDVTMESMQETSGDANGHKFDVLGLGAGEESGRMMYNELFHLNPLKVNLTFIGHEQGRADNASDPESTPRTSTASMLLAIPEKLVPSVDNAPIALNGLLLKHSFTTFEEMSQHIYQHYKQQLLQELLKILGSFDALGSPVSLVQNLGTGVKDLFYEPAKGITVSPKEFGKGLGRGGKSFVKKSVYGLFNSASKVVGSIGTGVAMISFDDDYQRQRNEAKRREVPRNALTGFGYGLKELGTGLLKGVAGIVTQPVKGFQEDGAGGLFKGIGQGLVGVVVKPAVGALDMIQRTTEGIKNTANAVAVKSRSRPPRFIARDRIIRPYDSQVAELQHLLHTFENGQYRKHKMWAYFELAPVATKSSPKSFVGDPKAAAAASPNRVLLSNKLVIITHRQKLDWRIKWKDVTELKKINGEKAFATQAFATQASRTPADKKTLPYTSGVQIVYERKDQLTGESSTMAKLIECPPGQVERLYSFIREHLMAFLVESKEANLSSYSTHTASER